MLAKEISPSFTSGESKMHRLITSRLKDANNLHMSPPYHSNIEETMNLRSALPVHDPNSESKTENFNATLPLSRFVQTPVPHECEIGSSPARHDPLLGLRGILPESSSDTPSYYGGFPQTETLRLAAKAHAARIAADVAAAEFAAARAKQKYIDALKESQIQLEYARTLQQPVRSVFTPSSFSNALPFESSSSSSIATKVHQSIGRGQHTLQGTATQIQAGPQTHPFDSPPSSITKVHQSLGRGQCALQGTTSQIQKGPQTVRSKAMGAVHATSNTMYSADERAHPTSQYVSSLNIGSNMADPEHVKRAKMSPSPAAITSDSFFDAKDSSVGKSTKPRKPMSGYIFYIMCEREYVVANLDAKTPAPLPDLRPFEEVVKELPTTQGRKKRKHRFVHGKISFTSLSKLMAKRWHDMPLERRKYYSYLARMDKKRYMKDLQQQKIKAALQR